MTIPVPSKEMFLSVAKTSKTGGIPIWWAALTVNIFTYYDPLIQEEYFLIIRTLFKCSLSCYRWKVHTSVYWHCIGVRLIGVE